MSQNTHHNLLLSFHLLHIRKKHAAAEKSALPPKGCVVVKVGGDDKEQQKFVIPVMYLTHPLFLSLLKVAEEEYGFDHKDAITIPCHVEYFYEIQGIINRDTGCAGGSSCFGRDDQLLLRPLTCFTA